MTSNETAAASGDVSGETVFVMGTSHGGLSSDGLAGDEPVDHDDSIEVAQDDNIQDKKPKEVISSTSAIIA